jgi:hypothetical protein
MFISQMPFPDKIRRGVWDELLDDVPRSFEMQRQLSAFPGDDREILEKEEFSKKEGKECEEKER